MAVQSSFYNTDGITRTFPSTKHIATKQHCAVYLKLVSDSSWEVVSISDYELVNNSVVFITAPSTLVNSMVEVRVADEQDELSNSPSDIALVASSIANVNIVANSIDNVDSVATSIANVNAVGLDLLEPISEINTVATDIVNVNTVATNILDVNTVATNISDIDSIASTIVPNIAEILLADTNATTATAQAVVATTKANEASASATLAEGYANSINPATLVGKDSDTGAAYIPSGTTAQRPASPASGYMRFNTDLGKSEVWDGTTWASASVNIDSVPTDGSGNAVSSNGVFDSLAQKAPIDSPAFTTSATLDGISLERYYKVADVSASGTAIDFTGIPSWAKKIKVVMSGISTNGISPLLIQVGDSGGVENTGYKSTSSALDAGASVASYTGGFGIKSSGAALDISGIIDLINIGSNNWVLSGVLSATTTSVSFLTSGNKTLSGTLDRIRITTGVGTDSFDAGTVTVIYEG